MKTLQEAARDWARLTAIERHCALCAAEGSSHHARATLHALHLAALREGSKDFDPKALESLAEREAKQ